MTSQASEKWEIKGDVIGACNCDYGCPCTFDAPPTYGFCDGFYFIHINEGNFGGTQLGGLNIGWGGHAPGALHEGNITALHVFDEKASAAQRSALESLFKGEAGGIPGIFAGLTATIIGPLYVPTEWQLGGDGYAGRAKLGDIAEVELDAIRNPVTGAASPFTVSLGNGFLTDSMEMGTSSRFRLNHPDLSYDNTGKFSTIFKIDWKSS